MPRIANKNERRAMTTPVQVRTIRCPVCNSGHTYSRKRDNMTRCVHCGHEWPTKASTNDNSSNLGT